MKDFIAGEGGMNVGWWRANKCILDAFACKNEE